MHKEDNIELNETNNNIKGKVLKAFRLANLMTRAEFSSRIGISEVYLGQVERGCKTNLSDICLNSILYNLNVSKEFFYSLMSYAITLEKALELCEGLSDEDKARYFMQEILYIILNDYHDKALRAGFLPKRQMK